MSLDSWVAGLPYESSSFATSQFGEAAKGKRLNGQARRLTSPHLEVLCRTSTGDYKAPFADLYCPTAQRGESHRRWLIDVMLFVTYDADRLIRNADFISIARKGNPQPFEPACQRQAEPSEPSEPSEPGPLCGPVNFSSDTPPVLHLLHFLSLRGKGISWPCFPGKPGWKQVWAGGGSCASGGRSG